MRKLVLSACLLLLPAAASAQQFTTYRVPGVQVGAEVGLAFPIGDNFKADTGWQVAGRIAYEFGIGLTPQVKITYAHWGLPSPSTDSVGEFSIMPGLRWSILGGGIRPFAQGDIGFGHVLYPSGTPDAVPSNGLAWDVGGGVDLMVTSGFGIGFHLLYNKISLDENGTDVSATWMELGAGISITF